MDRRMALRQLTAAGVGITLLQACSFGEERFPMALNNLNVTVDQEELLAVIVETIIPEGEVPGARSLEADKFVWVMADDCLEASQQERFMKGLKGFDELVKALGGKSFESIPEPERATMLATVDESEFSGVPVDEEGNAAFSPEDVKFFLGQVKWWTITGYMQSRYIMTEEMPYALVPGSFSGCKTIEPIQPVNINA